MSPPAEPGDYLNDLALRFCSQTNKTVLTMGQQGYAYDEHGDPLANTSEKSAKYFNKAFKLLLAESEKGDPWVQRTLGVLYEYGWGVENDKEKAVEWYRKAANQDDQTAQSMLAGMLAHGLGTAKDIPKAIEWYQKAAEKGDIKAQVALGSIYAKGEGTPRNQALSSEWYLKAAHQGDVDAQYIVFYRYKNGVGAMPDYVLAYAWLNILLANINLEEKAREELESQRVYFERRLKPDALAEAQRLSSDWKKGQSLARVDAPFTEKNGSASSDRQLFKTGTGTMFIVSKTGDAVTNHHVAGECKEVRIAGRDGSVKVVTTDKVNDLALIKLSGNVEDTAPIAAEPAKIRQGEEIVVFGFPLTWALSSGGNLTPGVISAITGLDNNTNQIQITAPIQPGSSGSPVMNSKGEVVGVVAAKLSDAKMAKLTGGIGQNVNFAVSGQTLKAFLDANKVAYKDGAGFAFSNKSKADLADDARRWTLLVECWK